MIAFCFSFFPKGTRFRPLSLDIPKPLFPIAGFPIVQHHIEACSRVDGLREILLIGFFQPTEQLNRFIREMKEQFKIQIRYLQEYTLLGEFIFYRIENKTYNN